MTFPVVRVVGGLLVLDSSFDLAATTAIEKFNCWSTFGRNVERILHFMGRLKDHGLSKDEAVIVILNVDVPFGRALADALMPGHDWQTIRDRGEVPFARGIAMREGLELAVVEFDREAATKMKATEGIVVLVVDYGVAEVFDVRS